MRALTFNDLKLTLQWHNQPEIVEMYSGHPFPVNEEMERKWYDKVTVSNIPSTVFGVEHISDRKLIGLTLLKDINLINRSTETAIYIGDSNYKGKGFSTEALQLTLSFAFNELGIHRVWLKVRTDNRPALSLYKRIGFIEEGILRDSIFKNGKYHDLAVLSLLKDEFEEVLKGYDLQ